MAINQLSDPRGTFGNPPRYSQTVESIKASAAIAAKRAVLIGGTAPNFTVSTTTTSSVAALTLGIVDQAVAAGDQAKVITSGIVSAVPVDGTVAVGDILKRSTTTAGSLITTATPAAGEPIAVALSANASGVATVLVLKSI